MYLQQSHSHFGLEEGSMSVCHRYVGAKPYQACYLLLTPYMLQVVDCRVCGDPNSVLRFAFVEFTDEGMWINWIRFYAHRFLIL